MFPTLLASVVSGEALIALRRLRVALMIYALAGLLLLAGVGFLIGAGFVATAARHGSFYAALYFGAGFIALAIITVIVFKIVSAIKVRSARRRQSTEAKALMTAGALTALPALLSAKRGSLGLLAVPLAAVAGYMMFREFRPRRSDPPRSRRPYR